MSEIDIDILYGAKVIRPTFNLHFVPETKAERRRRIVWTVLYGLRDWLVLAVLIWIFQFGWVLAFVSMFRILAAR